VNEYGLLLVPGCMGGASRASASCASVGGGLQIKGPRLNQKSNSEKDIVIIDRVFHTSSTTSVHQ
jgi:hypothetical protein